MEPVLGGCRRLSPGCLNCYAPPNAGTLQSALSVPLYRNTTTEKGDRYTVQRYTSGAAPTTTPRVDFPYMVERRSAPFAWPEGKPSLIFVGDMAEIFLPERPEEGDRPHVRNIGQLPTILGYC